MKFYHTFIAFCLVGGSLFSSEADVVKRVKAYLAINDHFGASDEALDGLQLYPNSSNLWEVYLKALGERGDEVGLLEGWDKYRKLNLGNPPKPEVLENLCWGIIRNGSKNSSPLVRLIALLAAFLGNDARGVEIMCQSLRDSHAVIRGAAAELAGNMRDGILCEVVLERLKVERDSDVQLELIRAIGEMDLKEALPYLLQVLTQSGSQAEMRAAAIGSVLNLMEDIDQDQLRGFAASNRAGLRLLACECIAYLGSIRDVDLLIGLTEDTNSEVRASSLQCLGILPLNEAQKEKIKIVAKGLSEDPDYWVAISAAWLLTLLQKEEGQALLKRWMGNEAMDVRLLAAGALVGAGRYGSPLLEETFRTTQDRFVRVNLALGMISSRLDSMGACEVLHVAMVEDKSRWMKEEKGLFSYIGPSKVKFKEGIPNYPETVNQLLRLDLINMMAMLRYPMAQEVAQSFLRERAWGVTGMASALLLTEGDEAAVKIVEGLLKDPNQKVRAQAGLILGLWGGDEAAMGVLVGAYGLGHRDLKEQILEAMGNIRSAAVVPFLTEKLQEQSQTLRLIAASSLLRALKN